ncbi:ankyrin repeat domain-containing protein [Thiotrichales bacterium 19S11-10]|nr:ankyrin repeat domain-containing protein [Thiotrichales bacterium 19S11-10]
MSEIDLLNAVACQDIDAVKCLLEAGENINTPESFGPTPLHMACLMNNLKIVELLLQFNPNINAKDERGRTALSLTSNEKIINIIKQRQQSLNENFLKSAVIGDFNQVKILLEQGADINTKNDRDQTALHITLENNYFNIVELLLTNKADPTLKDKNGDTALSITNSILIAEQIKVRPNQKALFYFHQNTLDNISKNITENSL